MWAGRVYKVISRPFRNLSSLDLLVLWIRLISTILIIAFGMTLVVGPIVLPDNLCMGQFNTRPDDITQGLFDELKSAVEVFGSTDVNSRVGLTTSEILILTDYTARKTNGLPQYVTFSLYGNCNVRFTTSQVVQIVDGKKKTVHVKNSTENENCQYYGNNYMFDYRNVLSQLSLNIVLDYAYDQDLTAPLQASSSYTSYLKRLRNRKSLSVELLCAVLGLQSLILGITLWYYSIKGRLINPLKERILSHTLSLFSFVAFICGLISVINLVWMLYSLRDRVTIELGGFGFSLTIGKPWFVCLWLFSFFILLSTVFWSGLEWCVTNVSKPSDDGTRNTMLNYDTGVLTTWDDQVSNSTDYPSENRHSSDRSSIARTSNDIDHTEVHEMQELSQYSSGGSDLFLKKSIKPSTTMYF